MRICINGQETEIAERLTVAELISEKGLNPDIIVIEHNLAVLPKEKWTQLTLTDGDKLEIITFMGGG